MSKPLRKVLEEKADDRSKRREAYQKKLSELKERLHELDKKK